MGEYLNGCQHATWIYIVESCAAARNLVSRAIKRHPHPYHTNVIDLLDPDISSFIFPYKLIGLLELELPSFQFISIELSDALKHSNILLLFLCQNEYHQLSRTLSTFLSMSFTSFRLCEWPKKMLQQWLLIWRFSLTQFLLYLKFELIHRLIHLRSQHILFWFGCLLLHLKAAKLMLTKPTLAIHPLTKVISFWFEFDDQPRVAFDRSLTLTWIIWFPHDHVTTSKNHNPLTRSHHNCFKWFCTCFQNKSIWTINKPLLRLALRRTVSMNNPLKWDWPTSNVRCYQ